MPPRHLRDTDNDPAVITQLRRRRVAFDEIAAHLGITRDQAVTLYQETIEAAAALEDAEHKAEELTLADDAIRDLLAIARNHDPSARTSVEAWNSIRGWSEHKARVLGLYATRDKTEEPAPGRLHALREARRP